jgi:hypothetical protein
MYSAKNCVSILTRKYASDQRQAKSLPRMFAVVDRSKRS